MALAVACGNKPKVIPEATFAKIYEDMLISDQWTTTHSEQRKIADTTWFYDPIFERYGYNREDYYNSVAFYLQNPDTYAAIFRTVKESLETKTTEAGERIANEMSSKQRIPCVVPLYIETLESFKYKDVIKLERQDNGTYKLVEVVPDVTYSGVKVIRKDKTVVKVPAENVSEEEPVQELASNVLDVLDSLPHQPKGKFIKAKDDLGESEYERLSKSIAAGQRRKSLEPAKK